MSTHSAAAREKAARHATAANHYEQAAERVRAEVRRLADVHHDLHHAMLHRVWEGHAADRFARSIDNRLGELSHRTGLLTSLAGLLDEAARAEHAAAVAR